MRAEIISHLSGTVLLLGGIMRFDSYKGHTLVYMVYLGT
jgi:hypothetical protein